MAETLLVLALIVTLGSASPASMVMLAGSRVQAQPPIGGWDQASVRALVEAVAGDDPARAEEAASALGRRKPEVIETVFHALLQVAGPRPQDLALVEFDPRRSAMIERACNAVARMGASSVPALQRLVGQGGIEGAFAAATLGVVGRPAVAAAPALVAALGSENILLRGGARNALVKLGPGVVPALITGLVAATKADVRGDAAEILGKLAADPQRSVPALIAALRDPEDQVQDKAAHALGAFGAAAKPGVAVLLDLKSANENLDYDFGDALAKIVDAPSLRTPLHSTNASARRRAAFALGQMPPPAGALLIEALGSPVGALRLAAIAALRPDNAGAAAAVPVARLLHDQSPEIRRQALTFLLNVGRPAAAARTAVAGAVGDADPSVRALALEALGRIASSPAEIAPVVPLLRDPVLEVRRAAVRALAYCPAGPSTLAVLLELLQQPDMAPYVAGAVGALGLREGVEPLTRVLRSTDHAARHAAALGLARLGPIAAPATEELLRALEQEKEPNPCDFWDALIGIGPQAGSAIAQARKLIGQEEAGVCDEFRLRRQATR